MWVIVDWQREASTLSKCDRDELTPPFLPFFFPSILPPFLPSLLPPSSSSPSGQRVCCCRSLGQWQLG